MKKTYYFQHDFEAISDPKIQYIIAKFGGVGYGLWWRIVEMLHQDENNRLPIKDYILFAIGNQLNCEQNIVHSFIDCCIHEVDLLDSDGEYFWSQRVLKNVGKMQELKEKRSQAGKKSAEKRKKIKEKKYNIPSVDEVVNYFIENGYTDASARIAYNYYDAGGWCDSRGKKVLNWKQKMRGMWFRDEFKIKKQSSQFSIPIN